MIARAAECPSRDLRPVGTDVVIPGLSDASSTDREYANGQKNVLAIGIEPAFADLTAVPQLTPELIRSYIDSQIEQLRLLGFDVVSCLIDLGETAEVVATAALTSKHFDCVVIGAGLRQPAPQLLLFEKVINLVHARAPGAKICFNTNPADTAAAVQRWIRP
jgi:hypothetical protein